MNDSSPNAVSSAASPATAAHVADRIDAALISNPLSYTNHRRGADYLERLEGRMVAAGGEAHRVRDGESLYRVVDDCLARGCRLLVANGGDGTIHGVVSGVLRSQCEDVTVAVLPGGRTNVIAADLGMRGEGEALLARLLSDWRTEPVAFEAGAGPKWRVRRPTLRARVDDAPPLFGFLINGAGLAALIEECWDFRRRYRAWGLYGGLGTGVWVTLRLLSGLLGARLFRPVHAHLHWQQTPWAESLAAFSVTTNAQLPLGISPYDERDAEAADQGLKATAISGEARRVGWRLLGGLVARGRGFQGAPGYVSGLPSEVRVLAREDLRFHLDGESYALAAGQTLSIDRGPDLSLYRLP